MRDNRNEEVWRPAPALGAVSLEGDSQRFHIAVLDDEPMICELLHDNLCEQGHRVSCFATPQELLATLWRQRFDVILSDVKMPTMNGLEFYERVAERYPTQARRILFLSGDVAGMQIRGFLERTGCPYLAKPFRQAALVAAINELAQRNVCEESGAEYDTLLRRAA